MKVTDVHARMILDSRGNPTVEADVRLTDGEIGRASVPSGASRGRHEAMEVRDEDPRYWAGLGVERVVDAIRDAIAPALHDVDAGDQRAVDHILVELDGTPDRRHLGANGLLAVSVACAKAAAMARRVPLWQHLAELGATRPVLPLPMVNVVSGNLHALGGMDIQDVLVVPLGAQNYLGALQSVHAVYRQVGQRIREIGEPALIGDEGGFGVVGQSSESAIATVVEATKRAGLDPGTDVSLALDIAAAHLAEDDIYQLDGEALGGEVFSKRLLSWLDEYPICSIEDPFDEDAWMLWSNFTASVEKRDIQVLGDDLIATSAVRLERAIVSSAANAVLVKANQVGTLTEAFDVTTQAAANNFRAVISARSGETEDDWLADLAVATGAGQIKVGSIVRSERLSKYNRLLRIAEAHPDLPYAGGAGSLPRPTTFGTDNRGP